MTVPETMKNLNQKLIILLPIFITLCEALPFVTDQPNVLPFTANRLCTIRAKRAIEKAPGVRILVLTRYRSGSSFMGNLFGHHPDLYYVPEPLQLVSYLHWDDPTTVRWQNSSSFGIDPLYSCDFSGLYRSSLHDPNQVPTWNRIFCFRKNYSEPIKDIYYLKTCRKNKKVTEIPEYLPYVTSRICEHFKHVALKIIRLFDMNIVKNLMQDSNVKVIHNIRDPRGQMSSILSLDFANRMSLDIVRNVADKICTDHKNTLDDIERLIKESPHLANNYRLVRYEDVALHPHTMTRKMYKFTGLDFNHKVHEWIESSTTYTRPNAFGVFRVSSEVVLAWKKKLELQQVIVIQEACQEVLQRLGYDLMYSDEDLQYKSPLWEYPEDKFVRDHFLMPELDDSELVVPNYKAILGSGLPLSSGDISSGDI